MLLTPTKEWGPIAVSHGEIFKPGQVFMYPDDKGMMLVNAGKAEEVMPNIDDLEIPLVENLTVPAKPKKVIRHKTKKGRGKNASSVDGE